jgi:[ribosomal protein S5]-alanine N-acetyltransferase
MPTLAPFPELRTARLLLRLARPGDAAAIAALIDAEIAAMTATWHYPMPVSEVRERLERASAELAQGGALALLPTLAETADGYPAGSIVGWIRIGPNHEQPDMISLGYWTGAPFRRRGYIEEAVRASLPIAARHFAVDCISAGAQLSNPASLTLLGKLGMIPVGERPSYAPARGRSELCRFFEWRLPATGG